MAFIDYYKVLGISSDATPDEIKKAYRRLAKIYHPDKNGNSKESNKRFQEINEANEVLSDPEKRKKYDQYGEHWRNADEFEAQRRQYSDNSGGYDFGGFGGFGDFSSSNTSGFSDFFEQLFGKGRFHSDRYGKGEDIQATLSVSLRDAATTHKQTINIDGRSIRITIPAGISDGQRIRLKGYGRALQGGENGDLYIKFKIEPDQTFTREGNDLFITASTDIYTMLLGGDVTIPTLQGKVKVHIKAGSHLDNMLRLRGKGFPVYKKEGVAGDLFVKFKLQLPVLNKEQKELLLKIKELS